MKDFSELTEPELLALAIALEEEDSSIYDEFAHARTIPTLRGSVAPCPTRGAGIGTVCSISIAPNSASASAARTSKVRRAQAGLRPLGLKKVCEQAELMEAETKRCGCN